MATASAIKKHTISHSTILLCLAVVANGLFLICLDSFWATVYLPVVVFALFVVAVVAIRPNHVLKYSYAYFLVISNVAGVFVIEAYPLNLVELGVVSESAGSLPLITLYHVIFLSTLLLLDKDDDVSCIPLYSGRFKKVVAILMYCLVAFAIVVLISAMLNPFFGTGLDRWQYRISSPLSALTFKGVTVLTYFMPIVGIAFNNGQKKEAIAFIVAFAAAGFLTGNKFGLFLLMFYVFGLALWAGLGGLQPKRARRYIIIAIVAVIALLGVVFIHNSILYNYSLENNISYFVGRLGQQGQLWWRTYSLYSMEAFHLDEFSTEIASWFNNALVPADGDYGVYKIMSLTVADQSLFIRKISANSSYSFSTPATIYYHFGVAGMIVFPIIGALAYSVLVKALVKSIRGEKLIESIILCRILATAHGIISQSAFSDLFAWNMLFYLVVLFGLYLISKNNHFSKLGNARSASTRFVLLRSASWR